MGGGIPADDDLTARHVEVDPDAEQISLLVTRVLLFDSDAAGDDPVKKTVQFLGPLADAFRERLRAAHVSKRDLKRDLHFLFPFRNHRRCLTANTAHRRNAPI